MSEKSQTESQAAAERAERDRRAEKRREHERFAPGEAGNGDRRRQRERRGDTEPENS
jgi:hypothetical protein